jgi:hypothetical protein
VAGENKEMVRLIGRRLREAAVAANTELPSSILSSLERLSELESDRETGGQPLLLPQADAMAHPSGEGHPRPRFGRFVRLTHVERLGRFDGGTSLWVRFSFAARLRTN